MTELIINETTLRSFRNHLQLSEKSRNTIEKYLRDVKAFSKFIEHDVVTKELVISYKEKLLSDSYAIKSINSMIASLNCFFCFAECGHLKIRSIKEQRQLFCSEDKELTKEEYTRLVNTAEQQGKQRLKPILQTVCGTGICVSELEFITVEAVKCGEAVVYCKGKRRNVFIVKALQKKLLHYIRRQKIKTGSVFVTKNGNPVSRQRACGDI